MTRTRKALTVLSLMGAVLGIGGCSALSGAGSDSDGQRERADIAIEPSTGSFEPRWAIDMNKVREVDKYADSARFVAATPSELFGGPIEALQGDIQQLAMAACEKERVFDAAGNFVGEGDCLYYGNTQRVNFDHTPNVESDAGEPVIVETDAEGTERWIDPPGYLNLIAMYNTDRENQTEIRKYLKNGDMLVYFHPEDSDTTQFRAHHAAMYYETSEGPLAIAIGEKPYVHHVDNPTSYGPSFASGKTATPFHAFRFNPNGAMGAGGVRDEHGMYKFACNEVAAELFAECENSDYFTISDEMAAKYAYMARNWAFITNDYTPFASFHDLSWNDEYKRVDQGQVGAKGVLAEVDRFAAPALKRDQETMPAVYCAGLVYTNMNLALNRPLNEMALSYENSELFTSFTATPYEFDDRYFQFSFNSDLLADEQTDELKPLGRLIFEPITASGIVDAWVDGYYRFPGVPAAQADVLRAKIIGGAAQKIADGFRYDVVWADRWTEAKAAAAGDEAPMVVTPEIVGAYAQAFAGRSTEAGNSIEGCDAENPETWNYGCMKKLELERVGNRYVPPFIYHVMANKPESLVSYVGTVIHRDLLRPLPGVVVDEPFAQASEFAQGGPDSSLYEHYKVPNGGRHVQRVLDVQSGPRLIGLGSKISTRISAANIDDVRVVLHPPGTFSVGSDLYACENDSDCIGDAEGIAVPVTAAMNGGDKVWKDVNVTFELFKPVAEGGLGCEIQEESRSCPKYNWDTGEVEGYIELGSAWGQWTLTVLDRGDETEGTEIANCAECATGGAHSNQWVLMIRDGAVSGGDDEWEGDGEDAYEYFDYSTNASVPMSLPDATVDAIDMCGQSVAGAGEVSVSLEIGEEAAGSDSGTISLAFTHHWPADLYVALVHDGMEYAVYSCGEGRVATYDETTYIDVDLIELVGANGYVGTWKAVIRDYDKDARAESGVNNRLIRFDAWLSRERR